MHSVADRGKQRRAQNLVYEFAHSGRILLSTQVVQGFYVGGLRKLALPRRKVQEMAATLMELPLVVVGPAHIVAAMQFEGRYHISLWDALIVAAAESGGADVVYTEDLNDG